MSERVTVGIDLGGTAIKAGVVTSEGEVLGRQAIPTPLTSPKAGISAIIYAAQECIRASGINPQRVQAVGVGTPGVLDPKKGVVREAANLTGWQNVPLRDQLAQSLELPVRVMNDANAAALGEVLYGVGRGYPDLILLTLGTGVGGGLVMDGRVIEGSGGLAGELGHMRIEMSRPRPCGCGKYGCLEAYVGAKHLIRRIHEALADDIQEISLLHEKAKTGQKNGAGGIAVEDMFQAADEGDGIMARLVDETAMALAVGIANLLHAFNPGMVVLAGGVAQAQTLREKIREFLPEFALPAFIENLRLETSTLGQDAGILGAAAAAQSISGS